MPDLHTLARYAVFAVFVLSVVVAFASWLVRARRVSPFGTLGRTLRAMSDPLIRPVEARLVRLGGNPVNAGWGLVVVVAGARPDRESGGEGKRVEIGGGRVIIKKKK